MKKALVALILVGCSQGAPTIHTSHGPPINEGAISLQWWDGTVVTDEGGFGRMCDRGCISAALEEQTIIQKADAGTPLKMHETIKATTVCLKACEHTHAVHWRQP